MRWIALFCVLVSAYPVYGQPPKVVVDVAVAATEAAKDDQPVMPDDFGQASRAVSAKWQAVESSGELQPGCTLYTSELVNGKEWCPACGLQKKILIRLGGMTADGEPIWPFRIVRFTPDRAEMTVPQWVSDTNDVEPMLGAREAGLKDWIERRAKKAAENSPDKLVVEVDGSDSRSIVLALAEAVRRQDDTQPAVQGFLPAVPLDVNDDLLKVLDALIGKDGYTGEGFSVKWPAGKRRVSFEPGIQVWFRKVVEVDATITAIEIDGRDVTLSLSGTILSQLTVRLK